MYVIDSSGWVEYLTDGLLADQYVRYLADLSKLVTPTIVLFETYRILMRRWSQDVAHLAVAEMGYTRVVPLDNATGIAAADFSLEYGLATADAFVYATARLSGCELVTSDADFRGLPGVTIVEAGASASPTQGAEARGASSPASLPAGGAQPRCHTLRAAD